MNENAFKIFPLGDAALTISFGSEISLELNEKVLRLAAFVEQNPCCGLIETVPAYSSLTFLYNPLKIKNEFPEFATAFLFVKDYIENALQNAGKIKRAKAKTIEIPVDFSEQYALDLEFIASFNRLEKSEVIEIFTARIYRVFLLGFLPGFAYLGELDARIAAPRKEAPRRKVPKGSVGIAGRQTGIYSLESPGGWQIIGRTGVEMFTPESENPSFFKAGDSVRFYDLEKK